MHLGLTIGPLCSTFCYQVKGAVPLLQFQKTTRRRHLISSWSKKKEPRYACLSEATVSHLHTMWVEVSSSAPHLLHKGLLVSPIKWSLLWVLCPLRRPITTLDCVLLKGKFWSLWWDWGLKSLFQPVSGYNYGHATLPNASYSHSLYLSSYTLPRDSQGRLRFNTMKRTVSCELVGDFVSSYPSRSRDPIQPHRVSDSDIIQRLLPLSHQRGRCFDSLQDFQSHTTYSSVSLALLSFEFHRHWPRWHAPQPEEL